METKENEYTTDTKILSLAGSGNIRLCDDYKYPINIDGIIYPSIRNAVLSWKTSDVNLKRKIAQTSIAADLKALEQSIVATNPILWSKNGILSLYNKYTFQKFTDPSEPLFAKTLLETDPKEIVAGLMKGQASFAIDELVGVYNFEGILLMAVRDFIKEQKTLTSL